MKIGILGTGSVGVTLAGGFVSRGHAVKMGARSATSEKASAWAASTGPKASHGTFGDAAAFGELVFNATRGDATLDALRAAGTQHGPRAAHGGSRQGADRPRPAGLRR